MNRYGKKIEARPRRSQRTHKFSLTPSVYMRRWNFTVVRGPVPFVREQTTNYFWIFICWKNEEKKNNNIFPISRAMKKCRCPCTTLNIHLNSPENWVSATNSRLFLNKFIPGTQKLPKKKKKNPAGKIFNNIKLNQ